MSLLKELDAISTWAQGHFVDGPQYKHISDEWKAKCEAEERLMVRPSPTGNSICATSSPSDARWIASRLNLASRMQEAVLSPSRERFERWAAEKGHVTFGAGFTREGNHYANYRLNDLWECWNGALTSEFNRKDMHAALADLGFPRGYYNKHDVAGLEIHKFTTCRDLAVTLHTQEHKHCILSPQVFGKLLADSKLCGVMIPVAKHEMVLRGYLGELPLGTEPYRIVYQLFSDAYSHPDSDNRIFAPNAESFILVPEDRQCALK